jgi:hypothetical protein
MQVTSHEEFPRFSLGAGKEFPKSLMKIRTDAVADL